MKTCLFLISLLFLTDNCILKKQTVAAGISMKFVGSTPCDSKLKSILGIPSNDSIEFMRWELVLEETGRLSFVLSINYGLSKPNTLDFKPGNRSMTIRGKYEYIHLQSQNFRGEVYNLISPAFSNDTLSLVKPGSRVLQVLQQDKSLMVGNGGWSYTLNLLDYPDDGITQLKTMVPAENILKDTSRVVIFEGRTPCSEISMVYNLGRPADCIKLKWRLTLNRDPETLRPSTYKLQRTDISETGTATGKWTVFCLSDSTIVYKLDPEKPDQSICILAGDENVLFFLDRNYRLFSGNSDFSYTLNRKNPV